MNTSTLTSETQADFLNSAYRFGKEDGLEDIGRRGSAYFIIGGEAYQAYDEGHADGLTQRRQLTGNLPMPQAVGQWLMARQRVDVRRLSGGSEQPKAHRRYQEGRDMDQELFEIRNGKEPILRYTDEMMEEIEAERF